MNSSIPVVLAERPCLLRARVRVNSDVKRRREPRVKKRRPPQGREFRGIHRPAALLARMRS